jgi:hypothetical protein
MTNPTQLIEQLVRALEKARSFEEGGTGLAMAALTAAHSHLEQPTEPAPSTQNNCKLTECEGMPRCQRCEATAPSTAGERKYVSPVETVADLINNLSLMDQELPIYGAQYIEHTGKRRCIAIPPIVSRERIKDSRWIGEGTELNAAVIWTRAEQPALPVGELTDEQILDAEKWAAIGATGRDDLTIRTARAVLAAARSQPVLEPLTVERLREIERNQVYNNTATLIDFARAIEAAHGITQGGKA